MLRLPCNPELEAQLLAKGSQNLSRHYRENPSYGELLQNALRERSPSLSTAEWIRFRILHRQFSSGYVAGLPLAVSAGRFLVRSLKRFRWNA